AHVTAGDCAGDKIGPALDAIQQDVVVRAAEALYALDGGAIRFRDVAFCTHSNQEIGEVDDFRHARCVFDDRLSVGERCSHQEIFRPGYRHGIEHETSADEPVRAGADVAVFDADIRTEGAQSIDVDIDGPGTDRASPGQGDIRLAEAREQRSEHDDRRTHRAHQLIWSDAFVDRRRIDLHAH